MPLENNFIKIPLGMECCKPTLFLLPILWLISSCVASHPAVAIRYNKLGVLKANGKMRMPTGTSSYFEMISKGLFVDKSLFLKEILEGKANERVTVITFPRRWGKTANLMMVRDFLQIGVYKNGNLMALQDAPSYKVFVEGILEGVKVQLPQKVRKSNLGVTKQMEKTGPKTNSVNRLITETAPRLIELNETLLISSEQYGSILSKYLGRYPVIFISFLRFAQDIEPASFLDEFKAAISRSFEEHLYMLKILEKKSNSPDFCEAERRRFSGQILKFESYMNEKNDEVISSVHFLSKILHEHFEQKVFVLIDEYDAAFHIQDANTSIYTRFLTQCTKDNKYLEKAILTGILPILMGVKSVLNDVKQHSFVNSPFHKHYGYTPEEVRLLAEFYGLDNEKQTEAAYWYNGFYTSDMAISRVYNPWSINNYMETGVADIYWVTSADSISEMKVVFNHEAFAILELLIQTGKTYHICFDTLLVTNSDLRILKDYGSIPSNFTLLRDIALKYFLFTGYLTITGISNENDNFCGTLSVPNQEIRKALIDIHEKHIIEENFAEWELIQKIREQWVTYFSRGGANSNLLQEKLQRFLEVYPAYLADSTKSELQAEYGNEAVVESTLSITLRKLKIYTNFYAIQYQNNINSSVIRPDILLASSTLGVLIEFKYRQNARTALDQAQKYSIVFYTLRRFASIKKILYIGCNVNGQKNVRIESKLKNFKWDDHLVKKKEAAKKVQHVKKMEKQKARRDKKLDKSQLKTISNN